MLQTRRRRFSVPPLLIALAIPALLAGCAQPAPDDNGGLAHACQLKACICAEDRGSIFNPKTEELLWRDNGDAYCPEGFHLEEAAKGKK